MPFNTGSLDVKDFLQSIHVGSIAPTRAIVAVLTGKSQHRTFEQSRPGLQ